VAGSVGCEDDTVDASAISLSIATIAVVIGIGGAAMLVVQRPRGAARARTRHPSSTPPLSISLERRGRDAHWRIDVRPGAATMSVDIVSYRPAGTDEPWVSEPIVQPIEIQPGGWVLLPWTVAGRAPTYDVVVAWTLHQPDGDVPGSRTFRVSEGIGVIPDVPEPPSPRPWVGAAVVSLTVLVAAGVFVADELIDELDDDGGSAAQGAVVATSMSTTLAPDGPAPTSGTTAPPPTIIDTTVPDTTSPDTTVASRPATTVSATTSPETTSPSTTVAPGPRVVISGRVEDCRFGSDCLIAGFTIDEFDVQPTEYTCEFSDGSASTFRFGGDGVETACSEAGAAPSITIEVDGVRSETLTRETAG
jgi:hypothetical protein